MELYEFKDMLLRMLLPYPLQKETKAAFARPYVGERKYQQGSRSTREMRFNAAGKFLL
jgi:hypothetical protein